MAARRKTGGGRRRAKAGAGRSIEQCEHRDKQRANNPPVGLVTPETDRDAGRKRWAYDPHLDPQLVWAGKAEHTSFEVPTVRPPAGEPAPVQDSLFEQPSGGSPLGDPATGAGCKRS